MHLRSLPPRSGPHPPASGTGTPAAANPPSRPERSFALTRWSVVLALVLMVGGVSTATLLLVDRMERRAAHGIVEYARMQSRLVQAQWTDALARIDALQAIAARVSQAQEAGETVRSLREVEDLRSALTVAGPPISQVSGVDLDGRLSWSTLALPDMPVSVADRDEVRAILEGGLDRSVGAPLVGRLSARRTIRFGRAVRDRDGRLLGLTLVSVDTARIAHLGLGLEQPGHSFIALLRDDGLVLARSDGQDVGTGSLGMTANRPMLVPAEDASAQEVTGTDGIRRTVVSRPVPGSGTTVVVALDEEAMFDGVRAHAAQMWRWSVLLDLALAALAALVLLLEAQFRQARGERMRHTAIRAQEALIRAIAEEANDLFAVLDSAGRFVYVNPASQVLLGVSPADLLGQVAGPCVAADYRAEVRQVLHLLANGGAPRRLVVPMLHRGTGEHRWMEVEASHITWEGAGPARTEGCFFIARDVTDRKRAEDALQQAREDLETVARAGPGTLYRMALDPDGTRSLLYLANSGHLYLGFSHEEASARCCIRRTARATKPGSRRSGRKGGPRWNTGCRTVRARSAGCVTPASCPRSAKRRWSSPATCSTWTGSGARPRRWNRRAGF
ncbi:MAG: PAS domain S-box protein [Rhodospirillales bacterium]|nr:PAS domain S-box protein [Rhodospirillales bacterium]